MSLDMREEEYFIHLGHHGYGGSPSPSLTQPHETDHLYWIQETMDLKAIIQFNTMRAIKEEPKTLTISLNETKHDADHFSEHRWV